MYTDTGTEPSPCRSLAWAISPKFASVLSQRGASSGLRRVGRVRSRTVTRGPCQVSPCNGSAIAAVSSSSASLPVTRSTLEYGSDGLAIMATVAPEIALTPSDAGISEGFSAITIVFPDGIVPNETTKRTGWWLSRMPNHDAMIPAACIALADGRDRNTIGTAGFGFTPTSWNGSGSELRSLASGNSDPASSIVEFESIWVQSVEFEGSSHCCA